MSIRDWFRRRAEQRMDPLTIDWAAGEPPGTGQSVSVEQALRLGPVFASGRLLASSVSMLPLQTYRQVGDRRERLPDPSLLRKPSVAGTRRDWKFRLMTSMVYRGNAVGLITARDFYEFPTMVEWLHPDEVNVIDSNPSGPGSYADPIWYWRGRRVNRDDLVHIPWFPVAGRVWGLSPIGAYASTVATGLSAKEFSRKWFDSGGVPPGTFKNTSQTVDQDQADVIKRRLVRSIRTHEPIVYGADWDYTPITVAANEAKFVETMRLGATEIAGIYGIPPAKIGGESGGSSVTYANVEQESIDFVQFTLLPWLTTLEDALSALLPRGQYVKFNVDALIRPDAQTRYANYRTARDIGLMSLDEIRALEDLPPIPGGRGQDYTPLEVLAKATPVATRDAGAPQLELLDGEGAEDRVSKLEYGRGSALWKYWAHGKGYALWAGAVHKWTTLHRLLISEGVPAHEAAGLTTNIIEAVMPGYMAQAHKKSS